MRPAGAALRVASMRTTQLIDRARATGKTVAKALCRRPFIICAPLYRRLIPGTRFVGVTGSGGKTTTKDLVFTVLDSKFRTHRSHDTNNQLYTVARTMFEIRPGTQYCVQEVGISGPGSLDQPVKLLAPSIAVVTNVRTDHGSAFSHEDGIAHEKSKLVRALGPDGIAVLNADDERVLAMAALAPGEVVTYGTGSKADVRAEQVTVDWPRGVRFVVHHRGESFAGEARLQGAHLVPCALAAVAVGLAAGMSVPECLAAIRDFQPALGRMSLHSTKGGVTFIRDDWKAPLWSVRYPMDFLGELPARRKLVVLGNLSDYRGNSYPPYRDTVRHALGVADEVLLVGDHAGKAERIARNLDTGAVRGFASVEAASRYVCETVESGDVVLLKGSNISQHIGRIALACDQDVKCWRVKCRRDVFCDNCALVSVAGSA